MDEGSENVLFRLYNLSMFFLALCLKVYQQNSRVYSKLARALRESPDTMFSFLSIWDEIKDIQCV